MSLIIIGINHKTATIALREQLAFSPDTLDYALTTLSQHPLIDGCVILSTCNRSEIYISTKDEQKDSAREALIHWIISFHKLAKAALEPCLYVYTGEQAVMHLMRVASGLDSLVLGEPQILGQVKTAFFEAKKNQSLCPELEKLFQRTFSTAKRVRTETAIGSSPVSVAFSACSLAKQIFESFESLTILLVGAGQTIELVANYICQHKIKKLIIANRTREKALLLAGSENADAITLPEIADNLHLADIVISSTASPLPIIGKGMVERGLKLRKNKPMLLIDIAVPRDIEAEVGQLSDIYLYTVDDLQAIIQHNLAQRKIAAEEAEYIIAKEVGVFTAWLKSQSAVKAIKYYRDQANKTKSELEQQALHSLDNGEDPRMVLKELANKLTNKLIHMPTKTLQCAAAEDSQHYFLWLKEQLGIE